MISPKLLEVLACPRCEVRPALQLEAEFLRCPNCHARYPIKNGIPQLLPENAIDDAPHEE
jgi:uncharacterized protein YbaR (Trm112 family)